MTFNKTITFPAHIMFQEFDTESILLDIRSQEHFGLNPVGSLFFSHINNGLSLQESFNIVLKLYEVNAEQLEKDLDLLIEKLLEYELIEVA